MSTFLDDLGPDYNPAGMDQLAAGQLPPGFYHATLDGAKRTESKQKGTQGWELTFKVKGGTFDGVKITETLWITESAKTKDRLALFGSRLGLLLRDGNNKLSLAKGKSDFMDCLDAEVVIKTGMKTFDREDGTKGQRPEVEFGGIYDPNDPKTKEMMAKAAAGGDGAKAAGGKGAATTGQPAAANGAAGGAAGGAASRPAAATGEKPKPNLTDL